MHVRPSAKDHFAAIEADIWAADAEEIGLDHETHARALKPVVQGLEGLTKVLDAATQQGTAAQRKTAEELVGVIAQVVEIVTASHATLTESVTGLIEGVKGNGAKELGDTIKALKAEIGKDNKMTRAAINELGEAMLQMSDRLESLEKVVRAPRETTLVRDASGVPIKSRSEIVE